MTEKELLQAPPKQLFKLSKLINQGVISYDDLADIIPGILHINNREDLALEYISKEGCNILRYSLEELRTLGAEVFEKHQSHFTRTITYPKLMAEIGKDDPNHVIPFFQDWQYEEDEKPVFHFTSTKILNNTQLISISLFPDRIEYLTNAVNRLFGMNKTYDKYFCCYKKMTKREKEILGFLGQELSRKEISNLLFIDEKTVKKHCENIYKKLNTSKRTELEKIARAFATI
ncbi:LuxR C-terminal-related transcriptional regulator [uncultured Kriegella sp.]|uniref:LuxR C-terminal-related transcriptional regulator n=1 Tax=uncultured Kriegella sp. TaxID=1798910 RepID=UPI0030D84A1E|tara:strand:- start:125978 stop:126670 length:693 start_codon:yes stop_codon:yes gene_type:complete